VDDCAAAELVDAPPCPAREPTDLAYILFTSGSTGVPKGVMIDHQGALNTVADINGRFGIGQADVVFGLSSLHFDLSVYDIFGAAWAGATLVLPPVGDKPLPDTWLAAMRQHGVTVWNSVPALMQLLVDAAQARGETLPALRHVLLSGDWIPVTLPGQLRHVAPDARVVSLGGATEASIWSIFHPIQPGEHFEASVPYGRPLANQRWHVLQDDGADSPEWVPGQLCIAGDGLAVGYWQDAHKTETAFARHPVSGERLYRTGDLGRWCPGGDIEFLGRVDLQVKIQGYRIEPGEVEQALLALPSVQAAVVLAQGSAAGRQLLAYAVPREGRGAEQEADAVLAALRLRLPGYMVPGRLVWLDRLPLTPNGKVDRQALLVHDTARPAWRPAPVAPRTATEAALLEVWEDVLEVSPISIHDDFFELGGQSFAGEGHHAAGPAAPGTVATGRAAGRPDHREPCRTPAAPAGLDAARGPAGGRRGHAVVPGPSGRGQRAVLPAVGRTARSPGPRSAGCWAGRRTAPAGHRACHGSAVRPGAAPRPAAGALPAGRMVVRRCDRLRDGAPARAAR